MFSKVKLSSGLTQWYTSLCCCLGTGITMASTIALNSLLVSSLQSDPDINLTFEEASWIGETETLKIIIIPSPHTSHASSHLGHVGYAGLPSWRLAV